MKHTKKIFRSNLLIFALIASILMPNVAFASSVVKGPDVADQTVTESTKTTAGKTVEIKIVNSILTLTVDGNTYEFKVGASKRQTDAAVINEDDELAHIITLGGLYYVLDLRNGAQLQAWKEDKNFTYCLERNKNSYPVKAKNLLNSQWFTESSLSNARSRLMTRAEFDKLINGEDPSVTPEPATPVPTVVPTQVPTQAPTPTVVPTQTPTQAPTPTVAPTAVPTMAPLPDRTPDIQQNTQTTIDTDWTIDGEIHTKFDANFWWDKFSKKEITWEQLKEVAWQEKWDIRTEENETETTYYFYNEDKTLAKTETVKKSIKTESGTGNGSSKEETKGDATSTEKEEGKGGVSGTIDTTYHEEGKAHTDIKSQTDTYVNDKNLLNGKGGSAAKTSYNVKRKGKKVSLTMTVSGKTGVVCRVTFNKKKRTAKFDGITYKNVKYVGYTSKSRQILLLKKNGKVLIVPRAKGKVGKTYVAKTLKGKWKKAIEGPKGLVLRVTDGKKVMGVKSAQPKKL